MGSFVVLSVGGVQENAVVVGGVLCQASFLGPE